MWVDDMQSKRTKIHKCLWNHSAQKAGFASLRLCEAKRMGAMLVGRGRAGGVDSTISNMDNDRGKGKPIENRTEAKAKRMMP